MSETESRFGVAPKCSVEGCKSLALSEQKCEFYEIDYDTLKKDGLLCNKHVVEHDMWKERWGVDTAYIVRTEKKAEQQKHDINSKLMAGNKIKESKKGVEDTTDFHAYKLFQTLVGGWTFDLQVVYDGFVEDYGKAVCNSDSIKQDLYARWFSADPVTRIPDNEKDVAKILNTKPYLVSEVWPTLKSFKTLSNRYKLIRYNKIETAVMDRLAVQALAGDRPSVVEYLKYYDKLQEKTKEIGTEESKTAKIPQFFKDDALKTSNINSETTVYETDYELVDNIDKAIHGDGVDNLVKL